MFEIVERIKKYDCIISPPFEKKDDQELFGGWKGSS